MRTIGIRITVGLLILTGTCLYVRRPTLAQTPRRFTGTYTNMRYVEEADDVVGEELKIVVGDGGRFQGALQFAQGVPEDLIIVGIQIVDNKIDFVVPDGHLESGKFSGTINGGVIHGQLRTKNGATEVTTLKRGKSYWD